MIDHSTVEKIIDTAEIVDIVQEFVNIKKRGVNYVGLCPFHNEKTPSFTVSTSKGIYKCFGCGKGGNVVNFIMEHEHFSYYEALKYLAKKYNIEIVEKELTAEEIQQKNERESLLIVSGFAQKHFSETLHQHQEGIAIGLSYLHERGFREDIIEKFQMGYCLEKKDGFTQTALKNGYKLDYLLKTGLSIQKENFNFDRFNGRIIFPIHSLSGRVIGFGGRILKSDPRFAKYLNSPESDIYHKSKVLYGLFYAKKSLVQNDKCYLVEGYTDVLSLYQAGIENVVASSGTSLTVEQIRLIKRFTKNITIIYDGDPAGVKASLRGIDLVLEEGLNVKILLLPEGEDPDSFSKKHNSTDLVEYINKNEKDFIAFKTQLLLNEAENDPVKKANLITDIIRSIAVIPESIIRSVFIKECSNIIKVNESVLYSEINKIRRRRAEQKYKKEKGFDEIKDKPASRQQTILVEDVSEAQEREVIRLLLNYGNKDLFKVRNDQNEEEKIVTVAEFAINEIQNDELEFINPVYKQIFEEFQHHLNNRTFLDARYFINHPDEKIRKLAADLISLSYELSKIWKRHDSYIETEEMKLKEIVPETLIAYKNKRIILALGETKELLKKAQEDNKIEEIEELQQKFILLNSLKKELSRDLGERIIL